MEVLQNLLADWFINLVYGEGQTFQNGLIIGIVFTFLFIIVYKLFSPKNKKSLKGLSLKNSSGQFYVTIEAIKNLIIQAISSIEAIEIVDVKLSRWRKQFILELVINIRVLNNVDSLRYHLEQQVLKILADNFSMRHNVQVNISVKKFLVQPQKAILKNSSNSIFGENIIKEVEVIDSLKK